MIECVAELRVATRLDQAVYCENNALPGSNYCGEHVEPEIQDGCVCESHDDPEHDVYCACCV